MPCDAQALGGKIQPRRRNAGLFFQRAFNDRHARGAMHAFDHQVEGVSLASLVDNKTGCCKSAGHSTTMRFVCL